MYCSTKVRKSWMAWRVPLLVKVLFYICRWRNLSRINVNLTALCVTAALKEYLKCNNCLPSRIIVYRDGVGDGQLLSVVTFEVAQILESIKSLGADYTWVVVLLLPVDALWSTCWILLFVCSYVLFIIGPSWVWWWWRSALPAGSLASSVGRCPTHFQELSLTQRSLVQSGGCRPHCFCLVESLSAPCTCKIPALILYQVWFLHCEPGRSLWKRLANSLQRHPWQ